MPGGARQADVFYLLQNYVWGVPELFTKVCVCVSVLCVFLSPLQSPDFEIQRQMGVVQSGGIVQNETRAYDSNSG